MVAIDFLRTSSLLSKTSWTRLFWYLCLSRNICFNLCPGSDVRIRTLASMKVSVRRRRWLFELVEMGTSLIKLNSSSFPWSEKTGNCWEAPDKQVDAFDELFLEYRSFPFSLLSVKKLLYFIGSEELLSPVETAAALTAEELLLLFLPPTWIKFRCTCLLLFENGAF